MRAVVLLLLTVATPTGALLPLPIAEQETPALTSTPAAVADAVGAAVDPLLRRAVERGPQRAVVVFAPEGAGHGLSALRGLGLEHHPWHRLGMAAAVVDARTLPLVERLPGIESVWSTERMRPLLDQSTAYVGARAVASGYGTTGKGVTVLVVDSGVDGNHPDLRYGEKLLENVVPTMRPSGLISGSREGVVASDPDGHGTHVAGIVAGAGKAGADGHRHRGVAPGAGLVGYQAGLKDDQGEVTFDSVTVLEAFEWALANEREYGIRIVSNSWGANGAFEPRNPVNLATFRLYKAGLLVVFAAGNEGERGAGTLNKYSVAPWVLSVGAGDYFNQVPSFSSRGTDPARSGLAYDHPDLVAPGVSITSARPVEPGSNGAYYQAKSGSSMAAPHVAGIAALLLERNPQLSPDDLMDVLTGSATPLPGHEVWDAGAGYANALMAHQLAARVQGNRQRFLEGHVKYAGPASQDPHYERDAVTVGYGKGAVHRLRAPEMSVGDLAAMLLTTWRGWALFGGLAVLLPAAFGGRERPDPPSRPRVVAPLSPPRVAAKPVSTTSSS